MPLWALVLAAIAAAKVVLALGTSLPALVGHEAPSLASSWVHLLEAGAFGSVGAFLVLAAGEDDRARWLGGTLLLIAAPFADVALEHAARAAGDVYPGSGVRPDAFLPLFFWMFLRRFPAGEWPGRTQMANRFIIVASVTGIALFFGNLVRLPPLDGAPEVPAIVTMFQPNAGGGQGRFYWILLFGLQAPALPLLVLWSRRARGEERRRATAFGAGLAVGGGPIVAQVLAESLIPAYDRFMRQPNIEAVERAAVYGLLACVPFMTAYSVLVDRILDLRFVLRAALRYTLAKYTLVGAVTVPFLLLGAYVYSNRHQSLAMLLLGRQSLALAFVIGLGLIGLRLRQRAIDALDRRFFREQYDSRQILTSLAESNLATNDVETLGARVCDEVDRALHAHPIALLVLGEEGTSLRAVDHSIRPLALTTMISSLAAGAATPLRVDLDETEGILARLPDSEREWLADSGFRLLIPLLGADGSLTGLLGLGQKRSGLVFTADDTLLLTALAGPLSLAVENRRLRRTPGPPADLAAVECQRCQRVHPPDTTACCAGAELMEAPVPFLLRGTFRLQRRLGQGGMGIVYLGHDQVLGRPVAIKTLPRLSASEAARLRQEARTMAQVRHPHLATIFGVETWRGTPLLIVEYLPGGTLADALRARRMLAETDVLDWALMLIGALDHLHQAGFVHCDIKPSNIAFNAKQQATLLDFGVAQILGPDPRYASHVERFHSIPILDSERTTQAGVATPEKFAGSRSAPRRWIGTPAYMSPEAIVGAPPAPTFDLWSLAVVLYEAIGGAHPFLGPGPTSVLDVAASGDPPDIRSHHPQAHPQLARFFHDALARSPKRRPQTAADFRHQLDALREVVRRR